jgi:hypothetical protein
MYLIFRHLPKYGVDGVTVGVGVCVTVGVGVGVDVGVGEGAQSLFEVHGPPY